MKELNLCELLKGHEGETFYSSLTQGNITLKKVHKMLVFEEHLISLDDKGAFYPNGECMVFPSKEQRDWNKWANEQKPKVPKTFNEIPLSERDYFIRNIPDFKLNKLQRSALALIKINQLIEVGYGGNVTTEEWCGHAKTPIYVILPEYNQGDFLGIYPVDDLADKGIHHIAFHTKEQAEEFLSYSENAQLVKNFYMIN